MRSSAKWFENAACYRETGSPCHSTASSMFCFGASLPYERFHSFVTKDIDLLPSLVDAYRNLAGLPECWPVIRELLCTVYLSPCEQGRVKLVSRRLCLQAERSCRFLIKHSLWPSELSNCSDSSIYSDVCTVYEVSWKFFSNSTKSSCVNPLVMTKVKQNWYLPYCGFNCTNSWLKSDEHIHLTRFMIVVIPMIFVFSIISLAILFTGGHHNNAVIKPLLWNIVCQLDVEVCWLVPLFPSARKLIVCNEDGTIRLNQPGMNDNLSCTVQFFFLYFGIIGSGTWLLVLFYLQYLYCTRSEALAKKLCSRMNSYSHLVAWVLPMMLTVAIISLAKVEADGISGVCFMGYTNPVFLLWFVHVPLSLILLLCFCLLFGGLITRHRSLLKFNRRLNGDGPQYKFSFPLSKLWILLVSHSALLVASWFLQLNDVFSLPTRQHAFLDYILCQLRNNLADETCDLHGAPDIRLLQLHMFLLFVPALINFWVCVNEFVSFRNQLARFSYFLRKLGLRGEVIQANGNIRQTESDDLDSHEMQPLNRTTTNGSDAHPALARSSQANYSISTGSSFADLACHSDPEAGHRRSKHHFMMNFRRRSALRHNKWYNSTVSLRGTSQTPTSLKSGTLPPDVQAPSMSYIPFPDVSKYPNACPNGWPPAPAQPYNWWCPPSPWFYYYSPPPFTPPWSPPMSAFPCAYPGVLSTSSIYAADGRAVVNSGDVGDTSSDTVVTNPNPYYACPPPWMSPFLPPPPGPVLAAASIVQPPHRPREADVQRQHKTSTDRESRVNCDEKTREDLSTTLIPACQSTTAGSYGVVDSKPTGDARDAESAVQGDDSCPDSEEEEFVERQIRSFKTGTPLST